MSPREVVAQRRSMWLVSPRRVVTENFCCLQRSSIAVVEQARPKDCPARLCVKGSSVILNFVVIWGKRDWRVIQLVFFTGSLVIPRIPHLLFNTVNIAWPGWKPPRCLKAKIPFWVRRPRRVNLEDPLWVRLRVLVPAITAMWKFQFDSKLNLS